MSTEALANDGPRDVPGPIPKWHLHRRLYDWVLHWAHTPYGTPALALLAVSEASWLPIPVDPLPAATHERLRQALLALDGSLAGVTYRQIATTIFGDERVRRDWDAASRFLKERTRRLVAKGRELMNGGYRDLLR